MPTVEYIKNLAAEVNKISEKYQLIHATFAIEKLIEDKLRENVNTEIAAIRNRLALETDKDVQDRLFKQVQELRTDVGSKVRIIVEYLSQIEDDSARLTRSSRNTFLIFLPKSMENVRKPDGTIDFERMGRLRKLMAHELGHIVLHTGILCPKETLTDEEKEAQAELFAVTLIELRKERNEEIYANAHYKEI